MTPEMNALIDDTEVEHSILLRFHFHINPDGSGTLKERGLTRFSQILGNKAVAMVVASGICPIDDDYYLEFFRYRNKLDDPWASGISIATTHPPKVDGDWNWAKPFAEVTDLMGPITDMFDSLYKIIVN